MRHLIAASVFALMGLVIFGLSVLVLNRCLPFSLRKELEEDQNVAVGVILGGCSSASRSLSRRQSRGESMARAPLFLLYLNVLVIATCGLVYELLAGTLASYVLGDSVTQFSLVIGVYLFALGVGAWLSRFVHERLARCFIEVELGVAVLGDCRRRSCFWASLLELVSSAAVSDGLRHRRAGRFRTAAADANPAVAPRLSRTGLAGAGV